MRYRLRETTELAELRRHLRADLLDRVLPENVVDDVVLAVHEAVASVIALGRVPVGNAIDVRVMIRHAPTPSVIAQIRVLGAAPTDLDDGELRAAVVSATATMVHVAPLVGGTLIELRRPFAMSA